MKRIFFLVSILTTSFSFSQNTFPSSGNVGINATDPISGFEVRNRLIAFKGDLNAIPTSGSGLEFFNQTGTSFIQSYDRAGALYNHLNIRGNNIILTPSNRVDIITGTSGASFNILNQALGSISFGNSSTVNTVPTISGKSNNSMGLGFIAATNNVNIYPDMFFDARENDNTDFTTLTSTAFKFSRFGTSLVEILRNGTVQVQTSDARLTGGDNSGRLVMSNATTTSYIELDGSTNTSPNKLSLITTNGTIGLFTNGTEKVSILNNGNMYVGNTSFGTSKINSSAPGASRLIEINREDAVITSGITGGAGLCLSTVPFQNGLNGVFGNNMLGYSKNPLESIGLRALTVPLSDTGIEPIIKLEGAGASTNAFSGIKVVDTRPILGVYNFTNQLFNIQANGNIGIGAQSPDSKLTVNGNIHAKEVKIDLNIPAPDYVFANDYKLKSLEEVENYIKQNSHLPEIPSAKEIEKNGLMLAEMNMALLKKMEEMTLYMIEMKKENVKMKKENNLMKAQQTELTKRIKNIENKQL